MIPRISVIATMVTIHFRNDLSFTHTTSFHREVSR